MSVSILLVEDEDSIADPLAFLLEAEGYSVRIAKTGREALEKFRQFGADLVLLDLMLPEIHGTEVCRQIKASSQTPIIMLTAKDTEADIIVGLEQGADDYVTKPYSTGELLARVRAVLRRNAAKITHSSTSGETLEGFGITLDTGTYEVSVRGKSTTMPLREFELLSYLMRESGRVVTREQIIDRVWGSDYFGDTKTLDVHIKRLRGRIEADPKKPELLTTVRGVGYRFG